MESTPKQAFKRGRAKHGQRPETAYEVKELQAQHREIIRLRVLGNNVKEIAARMEMSDNMVSIVLNSQVAKEHMARLQGERDEQAVDMNERLIEMSQEALTLHARIMRGEEIDGATPSISLRAKVAGEVMDRGGFGRSSSVDVKSTNMHISAKELEEIKERAAERKRRRDEAIEVSKPSQTLRLQVNE